MRIGYLLILVMIFGSVGCQPYPDHGVEIEDPRTNMVEFGTRHRLALLGYRVDQERLFLEFNQPLRLPTDGTEALFTPKIEPRLPIARVALRGVATVEVEFAAPLPAGNHYTLTIPPSWRARTGAALLYPEKIRLEIPNPEAETSDPESQPGVLAVTVVSTDDLGVRLEFSSPVARGELWDYMAGGTPDSLDLVQVDEGVYELHALDLSQKTEITLVEGMEAEDGSRLAESLSLRLGEDRRARLTPPSTPFVELIDGVRVLPGTLPVGSRVSTWLLDEADSLLLIANPPARTGEPIAPTVESTPPLFSSKHEKRAPATRFLSADGAYPKGLLLVKVERPGEKTERHLLATASDLEVALWAVNDEIFVDTKEGALEVSLFDRQGRVLSTNTVVGGEVRSLPTGEGWRPAGAVIRRGDERKFVLLGHLEVPQPRSRPGSMWLFRDLVSPAEKIRFVGLYWSRSSEPTVELFDRQDGVSLATVEYERSGHFVHGHLTAPDLPGEYALRFAGRDRGAPVGFSVSDLAGPEPTIELETKDDATVSGHFSWDGPGGDRVGVRSYLLRQESSIDGWVKTDRRRPNRLALAGEERATLDGGEFSFQIPDTLVGYSELVVELYDRDTPTAVLARETTVVENVEPVLVRVVERGATLDDRSVTFVFEAGRGVLEESAELRLLRRLDERWEVVASTELTPHLGRWEWTTNLQESGDYRLEWSGDEVFSWERSVESPDLGSQSEQIALRHTETPSAHSIGVRWPGLPPGQTAWVTLLRGEGENHTVRWSASDNGELGEFVLTDEDSRTEELIVVAGWEQEMRIASIAIDRSQRTLETPPTVTPSAPGAAEAVVMEAKSPASLAMVWWEGTDLAPIGPVDLADGERLRTHAPRSPGRYRLRLSAYDEASNAYHALKDVPVSESAHWELEVPPRLRSGDEFWAGVRYWPSPSRVTPTGLTSTVMSRSGLLPVGYMTTAGLVEPNTSEALLFQYRLPDFLPSQLEEIELDWELSVEGRPAPVQTIIHPLSSGYLRTRHRQQTLHSGSQQRLPTEVFEQWELRLALVDDEERATITIDGDHPEIIELDEEQPRWSRNGTKEEAVHVRHESGSAVSLEWSKLEPDPMDRQYSASKLYLLRSTEADAGSLQVGERCLLTHYLVVPETYPSSQLAVPMPGGGEARGCWLRGQDGLTALTWWKVDGEAVISLPELTPGEYEIVVSMEMLSAGVYRWPPSRVIGTRGERHASTPTDRLTIERR